jgi:HAMP domain-containing protein
MATRRLIGPTVLSLILCGFLVDYLFFSDRPWSVVGFISKVGAVFGAMFRPVFDPRHYGWVNDIAVPAALVLLALVLLCISIARAKSAMSGATARVDAPLPRKVPQPAPVSRPAAAAPAVTAEQPSRPLGWLAKSVGSFAVVAVLFLLAACVISHQYLSKTLEKNFKERARTLAFGVAEASGERWAAGKTVELPAAAASRAVAYIYVEDAGGQIVAHTPANLLRFLQRDFPRSSEMALRGAEGQYRDGEIYEIARRIEGRFGGYAHVAIWRSAIDEEIRLAMLPIVAATLAALLGTLAVFFRVIGTINRPLRELVEQAARISKGELVVPLELGRADEIGQIARSLERMRSSLRAVVTRLDESRETKPSGA